MKSPEQIVEMLDTRRSKMHPIVTRMEQLRTAYNGDMIVPLPELDRNERAMVANLVQMGIDQTAMRIASVMPTIWFCPERPGSKAAANRARRRRDEVQGWWENPSNRVELKLRRRARWLLGYATAPVTVRVGGDREPQWRLVNPLSCFPASGMDPDELVPTDAINVYLRSREWLERRYEDQMKVLRKGEQGTFEVIEYVDAGEVSVLVRGAPRQEDQWGRNENAGMDQVMLQQVPNQAERPLTVCPGRITLDRPLGQYDGALGMMHAKSMMMALSVIAQQRAIFAETWFIGDGVNEPSIVQDAEPMSGQVGIVTGTREMRVVHPEPSVFTSNVIDRLEYEAKNESSTPSQYGGYNPTNVRTGRAMSQLQEAIIDFPIQEAQTVLAESLVEEDKIAIAIVKAYGHKPVSMYVRGRGEITYNPASDFDSDVHEVRYAYAGADANSLNIQIGQKVGIGTLSKRSGMEFDPMVKDVETEIDRVTEEKVRDAFLASIQTLASNPQGPWQPAQFSRFAELVLTDKLEPYEAAQTVEDELKAEQLKQAQAQAAPQMPGMAMPGQPGAPVPAIPEPGPSQANLTRLLGSLRLGQMAGPAEQARQVAPGTPAR